MLSEKSYEELSKYRNAATFLSLVYKEWKSRREQGLSRTEAFDFDIPTKWPSSFLEYFLNRMLPASNKS